ncbi:hypothetical protein ADUPG1_005894, partial [Aduncisulcus paluster]
MNALDRIILREKSLRLIPDSLITILKCVCESSSYFMHIFVDILRSLEPVVKSFERSAIELYICQILSNSYSSKSFELDSLGSILRQLCSAESCPCDGLSPLLAMLYVLVSANSDNIPLIYELVKDRLDEWLTTFQAESSCASISHGYIFWARLMTLFASDRATFSLISPKYDSGMKWCLIHGLDPIFYANYHDVTDEATLVWKNLLLKLYSKDRGEMEDIFLDNVKCIREVLDKYSTPINDTTNGIELTLCLVCLSKLMERCENFESERSSLVMKQIIKQFASILESNHSLDRDIVFMYFVKVCKGYICSVDCTSDIYQLIRPYIKLISLYHSKDKLCIPTSVRCNIVKIMHNVSRDHTNEILEVSDDFLSLLKVYVLPGLQL